MAGEERDLLGEKERLILLAAMHLGAAGRGVKSQRVLDRAMEWGGLSEAEREVAWGDQLNEAYEPTLKAWYGALIAMTHQEVRVAPPAGAMFVGLGGMGTPERPETYPLYTEVRLTPAGLAAAEGLAKAGGDRA